MTNILEGIQFRTRKPELPTWNQDSYLDWQDVIANSCQTSFPTGTQFRMKPAFEYRVSTEATIESITHSKDTAMSQVATLIQSGESVNIQCLERALPSVSAFLAEKAVQFRIDGKEWKSATYLNSSGTSAPIKFRVRPDNYFAVQVKNGIAQSELTFDDVDDLEKYLVKQLRTSENNLTITRRFYGNITSF